METMNTINTMLIMDVIIVILGIYLIYVAREMKKTKKINRLVIAEEVMRVCKDEAAFAEFLSQKMMIFASTLVVTGLLMTIHETIYDLGYGFYGVAAVAIGTFLWFYKCLTDGRNKYC